MPFPTLYFDQGDNGGRLTNNSQVMKNKIVAPNLPKKKLVAALAAKAAELQAARLAADITAREAEAAKKRASGAKHKFKSAKKVWKQTRKAAKRAAKRAKQAREILTGLKKQQKPAKKKAAAKSVIRSKKPSAKPSAKKKSANPKRKLATTPASSGLAPEAAAPAAPETTAGN